MIIRNLYPYSRILPIVSMFFALIVLLPSNVSAQNQYTGIVNDNTVSSFLASYNPSTIVDSKTKFSISIHGNYSKISNFSSNNFLVYGTGIKYVEPRKPGYVRSHSNIDALNIKYEFNHKNAGAYSFRIRALKNLEGLPISWANNAAKEYEENLFGTVQDMTGFGLNSVDFTEHNFTYARTIFDRNTTFLKAGISLKILNGLDASYVQMNSGQYEFLDSNSQQVELTNVDANFGTSQNNNQLFYKHRGLAFDLGVTYEFRPDFEEQYYEMDGAKRNVRYDMNKYKWKVSASITDLGFLKFMSDSTSSYNFTNPAVTANANSLVNLTSLNVLSFIQSPYDYVDNNLGAVSTKIPAEEPTKFRMNLPASLHGNFDMNIFRPFLYVSYNMSVPLHFKSDITQVKGFFIQTLTPRIEKQNWSIMLPISHLGNGTMSVGCAGRFNFKGFTVFAGSNNLAFFYGQKSSRSRNFFAGISYNVLYKVPLDSDGDKISDEFDHCPFDPGLPEFNGCPDTDGDGIIDKEDICIYDKGSRKTRGCPDTDGDGVIDFNDMCPNESGLAIHYGCPDRDKDGVIDATDRCPDVPGIELNNGCPLDDQRCCTDEDGDGILNEMDKCPTIPGSVYNSGCPIDSSNINSINLQEEKDKIDANNTSQQVIDNPAIDLREQLITSQDELDSVLMGKNIIKNLTIYFDVDEASLTDKEREKMDKTFKVLPKNERYEVVLVGNTDRDGSLDYNLELSRRRAETIKRKLIDYYKFKENITVYYYGETKSIHSGDYTNELKQADRRVDVKLIMLPRK
jgi:outer membrane protein OmpA-like peptidoglycan-associated protein